MKPDSSPGKTERIFIAGIAGTFMAGLALIARQCGYAVSGCDQHIYPPMSTLLADQGIEVQPGYDPAHLQGGEQTIVIGNALSRGNPLVEEALNLGLNYTSGPQWLANQVLHDRTVIAVAGTHGKTTTSSMLAWILQFAGKQPGFLIGGKPGNFDCSARAGDDSLFVIEADEYDSAFFDKRSKFVHYRPHIAILNNLEFDHADIFDDLNAIKKQFHHMIRTIPANGMILANAADENILDLLDMGYWSSLQTFSINPEVEADWHAVPLQPDCARFVIRRQGLPVAEVSWSQIGRHNMGNALAAIAAADSAGISPATAAHALPDFKATDRRLQKLFDNSELRLFEDFAHHPTAIQVTLESLRDGYPGCRLIAVLEPRSNTMKSGVHGNASLAQALTAADQVLIYQPTALDWQPQQLRDNDSLSVHTTTHSIVAALQSMIRTNDIIIMMSNGSFDQLPSLTRELLETL